MASTTISRIQDELRSSKEELSQVSDQIRHLVSRRNGLDKKVKDLQAELKLLNENESSFSKYDTEEFPWNDKMIEKLRKVFKIQDFRSHQKAAINATMSKTDLILVMPTGGGKSLCFQLPAVLSRGVTLVISPLVSLMEDQLQGLKALGISTEIFNSQTGKEETKRIFQEMIDPNSKLRLLYATPEKLAKSKRFMSQLEKMYRAERFSRLVVDEVHCCSQWGHDFRPDYKFLGIMKTQYPQTPIIGLTATATSNVLIDIQKILNIEGCLVLRDSFYRPNLRYSVISSTSKEKVEEIAELIKTKFPQQSGIIYCLTVKDCEEVSKKLKELKIRSKSYHAQMEPDLRTNVQHSWNSNQIQVIVATVAFGMGINKLDVRFVIHYSMSKSVENYYQETGRAGRDGIDAECILYYGYQDSFRASCIMMTDRNGIQNVYNMLRYSLDQEGCRKKFIAIHFGDSSDQIQDGCDKCDNCEFQKNPKSRTATEVNAAKLLDDVCELLDHASLQDERMTALKLMDAWFGKGPVKLRVNGVNIPKYGREICEKLIGKFIVDGYLKEDFHFTPYSTISYIVPGDKSYNKSDGEEEEGFKYTFYGAAKSGKSVKNGNNSRKKRRDVESDSYDEEDFQVGKLSKLI